jgi:energy-coupling factor transporter ATP-binding protein EcfA2
MPNSNPFATRFIRPGAIDYLFPAGQSIDSLLAQLESNHWWGEIVGPHGSGKSTLVAALVPALEAVGQQVVRYVLTPDGDGRPECLAPLGAYAYIADQPLGPSSQLILDGYERISWWWRRRIQVLCRKRGAGLLVTAHQPLGLPPLIAIEPTEQLAQQIVQSLLPIGDSIITPADVSTAFAQTGGNLRETLFALFDVHHSRRGSCDSSG